MSAEQAAPWWKTWRRKVKGKLPFVRRRELERLRSRYDELLSLFSGARPADQAAASVVKPARGSFGREVCLFVSYAPQPALKRHVYRHVAALQANGFDVLLIVNTPHAAQAFSFDAGFVEGLSGLLVRENTGFDFGAWAHACVLHEQQLRDCSRVLLVNDSIVGPFADNGLAAVLQRARASKADLVGLTGNHAPRFHLQSYFLVIQGRALQTGALAAFMAGVANLPTKELVILAYETYLTARLQAAGCECEALYSTIAGPMSQLETWIDLARQGMPFLKTDVLEAYWGTHGLKDLVPGDILSAYEFANRT